MPKNGGQLRGVGGSRLEAVLLEEGVHVLEVVQRGGREVGTILLLPRVQVITRVPDRLAERATPIRGRAFSGNGIGAYEIVDLSVVGAGRERRHGDLGDVAHVHARDSGIAER